MKYKKIMFMLLLAVFLLSITCVSASEIDDTLASEDTNTIGLSVDKDIIEDNLQTSEENEALASTDYDEDIAQTDTEVLGADSATYSDLAEEIRHSGNITLTHKNYTHDKDAIPITISEANKVIDGNGAVIDMNGSTIRAFYITGSGVTIKNLTIKNANYDGDGGAIYFTRSATSGTVTNCNFTDNTAYRGGAVYFLDTGNVTNCNFTGNTADYGGAVYFYDEGSVSNCNFTNNTASDNGGAIYFNDDTTGSVTDCDFTDTASGQAGGAIRMYSGTVENCNFTNNKAIAENSWGGAIFCWRAGEVINCTFSNNSATYAGAVYFNLDSTGEVKNCSFASNSAKSGGAIYFHEDSTGTVTNCNFVNNTAHLWGGGVFLFKEGTFENCNFTGNNAKCGSAIHIPALKGTRTISNSIFLNNRADVNQYTPFEIVWDENKIIITFIGYDDFINAIYSYDVSFYNVTYWGANGIANTDDSYPSASYGEAGQNITVSGFVNDNTLDIINVTDADGKIVLGDVIGDYWISVRHDADSYYTEAETVITNIYVNVTETKTTNKTVNITAKSNIHETMPGKLLFILPDGTGINATYASNGNWWAVHTFDDYADYQINASYIGLSNLTINNATISITKADSTVNVSDVVLDYGETKNVTVTAEGATGVKAKINENNVTVINNYTIPISDLGIGNYTLEVTTIPDEDHNSVTRTVNITVNKASTEIILANETLYLKANDVVSDVAKLNPVNAGNLSFVSSNEEIAVAYDGTIWARINGTVTITVSFAGNENYAAAENKTITVYITPKDSSVSVENETLDLNVDDKYEFNPTVNPRFLAVKYSSSNVSVVTVTDYGLVRAVGEGTAIITLTVGNDQTYAINTTNVTVTVSKVPTEISLTNATVDLYVLDEISSGATLTPADAGNLTYASGNESVAIVKDGKIIAVGAGKAVITVSFAGDDKYAKADDKTVTVTVNLKDASASVNNSTLDLFVGDNFTIVAATVPSGLNVTYVPDNSGVVSVENGVVTALKGGTATITVKVGGDGVYAENSTEVTVKVSKIATEIILANETVELKAYKSIGDLAALSPAEAGNLTYTSSDEDIALVSEDGIIYARVKGTATVTVSFAGNDKYKAAESKNITVTVTLNDASVSAQNDTIDLKVDDACIIEATANPSFLAVHYASSNQSVATVTDYGNVKAVGEGTAIITLTVGNGETYAVNSTNVTVTVSKVPTEIVSSTVTTVYNSGGNLIVTLKDGDGNPISDVNITVDLNGAKAYTTDENGQVKVSTKGLVPKDYTAKITFNGNDKYNQSAKDVKVTVKKATPKITANTKTFKTTTKTKKYTITLKDNTGKPIKKATVYLKVGGKTYKAVTNSKGKATFKITKLNKKGTFKATVTYKGNKYYNKATKKVTIKVKSVWKTVSKGSKNSAIVKKIQRALKNHGYYLEYNGHYLLVDGIFWDYTQMAVKEFQNDKVLKVTGKVDEKTAKKLGII